MSQVLRTFQSLPVNEQIVTLDDVQYRLRMRWAERLQSWFLDIYAADGTALVVGRRMAGDSSPYSARFRLTGGPAGTIIVTGRDPYLREDLGTALEVVYFTEAETAALVASAATVTGLRVVVS